MNTLRLPRPAEPCRRVPLQKRLNAAPTRLSDLVMGSSICRTYSPGLKYEACDPPPAKITGWAAYLDQPLVVIPAPPQVVATEVVTRVGDPLGLQLPIRICRQVDEGHLPVGLVIVDAVKRRAIVVEVEEEPVLQGDPSAAPHHPAVVDVPFMIGERRAVRSRRGRHDGARRVATDEQAEREDGIDQAGDVADPRQAPRSGVEPLGFRQVLRGPGEEGTSLRRQVDVLDAPRRGEELDLMRRVDR